jgi:hypothetical protein
VADFDDDVSCAQVIEAKLAKTSNDPVIILVDSKGTKAFHNGSFS